jgi:hypothetical protein
MFCAAPSRSAGCSSACTAVQAFECCKLFNYISRDDWCPTTPACWDFACSRLAGQLRIAVGAVGSSSHANYPYAIIRHCALQDRIFSVCTWRAVSLHYITSVSTSNCCTVHGVAKFAVPVLPLHHLAISVPLVMLYAHAPSIMTPWRMCVYSTAQHSAAQHSAAQHNTAQHSTAPPVIKPPASGTCSRHAIHLIHKQQCRCSSNSHYQVAINTRVV